MNGARRFSSAPVNFDRFVVLARSNSRSLSPDHELHQMLRPFQSRAPAAVSPATKESVVARACEPALRLVDRDLAATQVRDCDGPFYGGSTPARRPTDDDALSSTQAATSTSRSVSGGGAAVSSAGSAAAPVSARPADGPRPVCPVGAETQELGHGSHSVDEVDPLLHAVLQLGSPLYDPVKAQFVCWHLHPLRRRSSSAHGAFEGISCDFCGHTEWFEETGSSTAPATSVKEEAKENDGGTARVAATSGKAGGTAFYRCAICEVDICRACLDEVHADARFHLPCLQCERCGAYESRRDAPLHRCATAAAAAAKGTAAELVLVDSDSASEADKEEEGGEARVPLTSPSCSSSSVEDAVQTPPPSPPPPPPRAPPRPPAPAGPAAAGLKHRGVPVGSPVRLGLARRPPAAPTTAAEPEDDDAAAPPPHKRPRASPPAVPSLKPVKPERAPVTEPLPATSTRPAVAKAKGNSKPPRQPVVGVKTAAPAKKEQDDSADDPTRALLEATVLPFARYEVHVTPRTADEVEEVGRVAWELHLLCAPPPAAGRVCVFYFATRLAAETCVDRTTAASLEALLRRHAPNGR